MLASIIASGLAVGAIYALIGVTYNTMFATSRVMSFTAGQLGMLGGVFGSLFVLRLGLPLSSACVLMLVCCAIVGPHHRVRGGAAGAQEPRPASLCALDARARADDPDGHGDRMEHRAAAIPARFRDRRRRHIDEKFWLPVLACIFTIVALELLYRKRSSAWRSLPSPRTISLHARSACRSAIAHGELCAGGDDRWPCWICRRTASARLRRQRTAAQFLWLRSGRARRPWQ